MTGPQYSAIEKLRTEIHGFDLIAFGLLPRVENAAGLKMRGSMHDKNIREFTIDGAGLHVGRPFRNISGILSGNFITATPEEIERLGSRFEQEGSHAPPP